MAFPPNYSQERNNRDRDRARKALKRQQKRDDKSVERKAAQTQADAKPDTGEVEKGPK